MNDQLSTMHHWALQLITNLICLIQHRGYRCRAAQHELDQLFHTIMHRTDKWLKHAPGTQLGKALFGSQMEWLVRTEMDRYMTRKYEGIYDGYFEPKPVLTETMQDMERRCGVTPIARAVS